jgi:hypothetical protein
MLLDATRAVRNAFRALGRIDAVLDAAAAAQAGGRKEGKKTR